VTTSRAFRPCKRACAHLALASLAFAALAAFAASLALAALRLAWPLPLPLPLPLAFAADGTQRIHVKGTARIDAHAARANGKLVLSGTVVDDAARPLPSARLAMDVARAGTPGVKGSLVGASPEPCSDGGARPVLERADLLGLPTDDAARFCVRLLLPTDRYLVHLESRPTGMVEGAKLDLPVDLALEAVTLRFDPERPVLWLDEEETGAATVLEVVASTEDDGVTTAAVGLPLTLANEAGLTLGTAATNASGRARFAVDPARLGAPGKGELRVAYAGGADASASAQTMQVERRTRVALTALDATDGQLPAGSPEDGVPLRVGATARCARRGCAGVPGGTVEARVGDAIVGAGSLEHGEAKIVATFAMPAANDVALRLRYVADAPWYQPASELAVTLPVRPPSPWKKLPLALAALAAVAWLVLARLPPRVKDASSGKAAQGARPPAAGVELVEAGPAARGWSGRVHDVHDRTAVAGARVAVERRGFERVACVVETVAGDDGGFVLPPVDVHPGDELVAEGPLHAPLRRPLPHAGVLDVALLLRRRALLDRLVAWARARGKPFDARPEATPGHVRRAAGKELPVVRWAEAVEQAAYGGGRVDAAVQGEIDRMAPGDGAAGGGGGASGGGENAGPR